MDILPQRIWSASIKPAIHDSFRSLSTESDDSVEELQTPCILEKLPQELVWAIFDNMPELVFAVRQLSSSLRSLVDDYVLQRTLNLDVEYVKLFGDSNENFQDSSLSSMDLQINLPKTDASKLLGLRLIIQEDSFKKIDRMRWVFSTRYDVKLQDDISSVNYDAVKILDQRRGTRIYKASVEEYSEPRSMVAVSKLFAGTQINKLKISTRKLTDEAAKHLIQIVEARKVEDLFIAVGKVDMSEPVGFLLHLSRLVRSLRIEQLLNPDVQSFFSVQPNVDWAAVFNIMFSNKMDKLLIEDKPKIRCVFNLEMLKERIPNLGKAVWFVAPCLCKEMGYIETLTEHRNDHSVTTSRTSFKIKHQSRKDEDFGIQ